MSSALYSVISSLPECNTAYGTALRLAMSAERSKTQKEKSEILKEASEIALNGLRESGRTFCSSLNTPCMVIFGLGIMVPMVLMSVLPMMGMSGLFKSGIDQRTVSIVTLVLIPAAVTSVIITVSGRNPVRPRGKAFHMSGLLLLSAVPAALAVYTATGDAAASVARSRLMGPSTIQPLIWPRSFILEMMAASTQAGMPALICSVAVTMATFGQLTPSLVATEVTYLSSCCFCLMSGSGMMAQSEATISLW